MFGKFAGKASADAAKAASTQGQRVELYAAAKIDGSVLPRAPVSAFRKRPVRLSYDKNEFWSFRLPSENNFLMQNFDKSAIFGKRHGLEHSPHIKAQMDIDSRIMKALVALSLLFVVFDMRRNASFLTLRENFRLRNQGRF